MRIDPATGELTLQSGLVISPALSRMDFLASPDGAGSTVYVSNEPYRSFSLATRQDGAGVIVFFEGETLTGVHLSVADPSRGATWADWSRENEMQRKAANDEWLDAHGVSPGMPYAWGSVWSGYDDKSGFSRAEIWYGARG